MGKPVTLDSDDVEAMLLAAEYMGKVEGMLRARRDDSQYLRMSGTIRESIDRSRKAWGDAIRTNDDPIFDEPPTESEREALRKIYLKGEWFKLNNFDKNDIDDLAAQQAMLPALDTLRRKRMVLAGQVNTIVRWGDKTTSATAEAHQVYRLTERGLKYCMENFR